MDFFKLNTSRQKRGFVHDLLMIRYHEVMPYSAGRIIWSKVEVIGWPEQFKSKTVFDLDPLQCLSLLKKLNEISFKPLGASSIECLGNRAVNDRFYYKLRKACTECGLSFNLKRINWKKIYILQPLLKLKTQDYRIWGSEDRNLIQKLILDDLIPILKQEQEKTDTLLLSILDEI